MSRETRRSAWPHSSSQTNENTIPHTSHGKSTDKDILNENFFVKKNGAAISEKNKMEEYESEQDCSSSFHCVHEWWLKDTLALHSAHVTNDVAAASHAISSHLCLPESSSLTMSSHDLVSVLCLIQKATRVFRAKRLPPKRKQTTNVQILKAGYRQCICICIL